MAKRTKRGAIALNGNESAKGGGFDNNPQNINRNGRPVSIRKQLRDLLESEGNVTMPANQVVKINDDGSVILKLPTQMQLAMKLSSWAMSKKGNDSLKAIQMIMEQIDGKPHQTADVRTVDARTIDASKLSDEALKEITDAWTSDSTD